MHARRSSTLLAALSGIIAAGFGLAIAELFTGFSQSFRSPVLDVGDRVIDRVPASLKNLAIELFGTADKIALLAGIFSLLALYAAILGVLAIRGRRGIAFAGIGLFGLVGVAAALGSRTRASPIVTLPTIVGALAAAAALRVLSDLQTVDQPVSSEEAVAKTHISRRSVVGGLAAVAASGVAAAVAGRALASRFNASASRLAVSARELFNRPPATIPSAVLVPVEGVRPFITPNADFYRIDTALTVPQVDAESWTLRIHGLTNTEAVFTYDDLLNRELVEVPITLTCVSNEIGGPLMGTAVWGGVRLDDLLDEVGIGAMADQIVGRSVDGYTCGFPVTALDGRDALIALAMNGEPLPLAHGFPARLIVPGLYGYVSATKWLTEIELTTFTAFDQYWVPRGWDAVAPIKTQSRIDTPRALSTIGSGPVAIGGTAWAQTRGISRVEIRIDDGQWQDASLADALNDVTWRQWFLEWDAPVGTHTITVRATDSLGAIQPEVRSAPMPNGATGWHETVVIVKDA